jgi:hypothetical protein
MMSFPVGKSGLWEILPHRPDFSDIYPNSRYCGVKHFRVRMRQNRVPEERIEDGEWGYGVGAGSGFPIFARLSGKIRIHRRDAAWASPNPRFGGRTTNLLESTRICTNIFPLYAPSWFATMILFSYSCRFVKIRVDSWFPQRALRLCSE